MRRRLGCKVFPLVRFFTLVYNRAIFGRDSQEFTDLGKLVAEFIAHRNRGFNLENARVTTHSAIKEINLALGVITIKIELRLRSHMEILFPHLRDHEILEYRPSFRMGQKFSSTSDSQKMTQQTRIVKEQLRSLRHSFHTAGHIRLQRKRDVGEIENRRPLFNGPIGGADIARQAAVVNEASARLCAQPQESTEHVNISDTEIIRDISFKVSPHVIRHKNVGRDTCVVNTRITSGNLRFAECGHRSSA